MSMLPDIDQQDWDQYRLENLQKSIDDKIQSFQLGQAINQRISDAHQFLGGADALSAAPAPPAPAPEPAAIPPAPPPEQPAPAPAFAAPTEAPATPSGFTPIGPALAPDQTAAAVDTTSYTPTPIGPGKVDPIEQPVPAAAATPAQPSRVFPIPDYKGQINTHWGEVLGGSDLFAPRGTPVVAMQGGKVIESGFNSVGGNAVLIQGDDGNQYYYAHGNAAPSVKVGEVVPAGTYLMPVGDTGDAQGKGTHLHLGIGPDIKLGADKYGGTGGDYDAVTLLRDTLAGKPAANQTTARALPATNQVADYIRYAAAQRGIDPDTAVKVAGSEGLNTYTGDQGSSFGPFQLHMGGLAPKGSGNEGGGMGDTFLRQTGLDPRDPSTWKEQVDFALDNASKGGWGPWHGAARVGVGVKDGIGTFKGDAEQFAQGAQAALAAAGQAAGNAAGAVGSAVGGAASAVGTAANNAIQVIGNAASDVGRTAQQIVPLISPAAIDVTQPRNNPVSQAVNTAIGDIPVIGGATQAALNLGQDLGQSGTQSLLDQQRTARAADELGTARPSAIDLGRILQPTQSDLNLAAPLARGGQAALDVISQQQQDVINRPQTVADQLGQNVEAAQRGDWGAFVQGTLGLATQIASAADPMQGQGQADLSPAVSAGLTAAGVDPNVARVLGQVANVAGPVALEKALPAVLGAAERGGAAAAEALTSPAARQFLGSEVGALGLPEDVAAVGDTARSRFLQTIADAANLRTTPAAADEVPLSTQEVADHATELAMRANELADRAAAMSKSSPERAADLQAQSQVLRDAQQQIVQSPPQTPLYAPRSSTATEIAARGARETGVGLGETPNARVSIRSGGATALTGTEPAPAATPTGGSSAAPRHFRDLPGDVGRVAPLDTATARAAETAAQARPYQPVMEGALDVVQPRGGTQAGLGTRLTRALTDRNVMLNQLQEQSETSLAKEGKKLGERLRAGDLARAQSEPAAQVKVQYLQDVVRDMGADAPALDEALKLTHNIQRSVATGERVTAEALDAQAPSHLTDELQAANSSQRMLQRNHDLLTSDQLAEADRVKASDRALRAAQRRVDRAQKKIDDWKVENEGVAQQKGKEAAANVKFAGEEDAASSALKLRQMEEDLGPARWARVQNGMDRVQEYERSLRARLVDSGVMSEELAAELDRRYPNWIKTNVLQYMSDDTGAGMKSGTKLGLSDSGLRSYTLEGSEKPVESPLVGLARYTYEVERMAMKNEAAVGFMKMTGGRDLRLVSSNYKIDPKVETVVNMFQNGEKQRYVTSNKWLGEAINGAGVADVPEWASAWTNYFRMLATARNPLFLAANAGNDAAEYLIRTSAIEGGPHHAGGILGTLFQSYHDAFQGLLTGEFKGEFTQQYLLKGGGMATGFFRGPEGPGSSKTYEQALSRLAGGPLVDISSTSGLMKALEGLVKMRWVERIGERIELAPHVAAYRRALMRGENPTQAMVRGRDVTLDFARGGTAVKYINNFIPFFNASVQGSAQLVRMARENPAGAALTVTTLIGVPTALAELWNRGYNPDGSRDEQRAQDYADVPQYEKDRGVVVMLPGEPDIDPQGNRRPRYVTMNLRNFAVFSTLARDVTARALGDETRGVGDTLSSEAKAAIPSVEPAQLLGSTARSVPGLSTAAQLAINHDLYRDRYIMSDRADQEASTTAKTLANLAQPVADVATGGTARVRPSAIDFAIQNELAGSGSSALGLGTMAGRGIRAGANLVSGAEEPLPEDVSAIGVSGVPVVGGLAGRFVRNQVGQQLQNETAESLTPSARQQLRAAGVNYVPGTVSPTIQNVPLLRSEQLDYQRLANRYVDDELQRLLRSAQFQRLNTDDRERLVQAAAQRGRSRAADEIMRTIPAARRRAVARPKLPARV